MRDPQLDLVVRGGTVVTAEGQRRADVGIRDGRVAIIQDRDQAATPPATLTGARDIDASGTAGAARRRRPARPPAHRGPRPGRARTGSTTTPADRRPRWRAAITSVGNMSYVLPWESIADRVRARDTRWSRGRRSPTCSSTPSSCRPARTSSTRSARAVRGGQPSMKIFMCMPTFEANVPAVHAGHEGRGRCGRHHAGPLRGSGHHRMLHDHARPTARTAISATSPTAGRSRRRRSPPNARSRCAGRPARRPTSFTCRRRARWPPARRRARRGCPCSSRRGRCTCT